MTSRRKSLDALVPDEDDFKAQQDQPQPAPSRVRADAGTRARDAQAPAPEDTQDAAEHPRPEPVPKPARQKQSSREQPRAKQPPRGGADKELAPWRRMVDVEVRRYLAAHAKLTARGTDLTAAITTARDAGASTDDLKAWLDDIPVPADVPLPADVRSALKRPSRRRTQPAATEDHGTADTSSDSAADAATG